MPAIPVLKRLRQEDCEFKGSVAYIVRPSFKKKKKKERKKATKPRTTDTQKDHLSPGIQHSRMTYVE
jgi:hypothetical protein